MKQHPRSEYILTVIRNFEKVLPMAKGERHLDMMQTMVNISHECGTVHCHGGWYCLAVFDVKKHRLSYSNGANEIAKQLGFNNKSELENWADKNPNLWGNKKGGNIFCGSDAFKSESRPKGAENLKHIVDHWKEVYSRVKALEDAEAAVIPTTEPTREDLTKSLAILPPNEVVDTINQKVNV